MSRETASGVCDRDQGGLSRGASRWPGAAGGAEHFCRAVLEKLDGEVPVLAAVRSGIETDFLRRVTGHRNVCAVEMRPERFDEIYAELRPLVLAWDRAWRERQR